MCVLLLFPDDVLVPLRVCLFVCVVVSVGLV